MTERAVFSNLFFPSSGCLPQHLQSIFSLVVLWFSYPLASILIFFEAFSPPTIRATCPSQAILLLFINLTVSAFHSVHGSFWSSKFHFHLVLGQKFSSIFSAQIFLIVVHFDLLMSRPHIRSQHKSTITSHITYLGFITPWAPLIVRLITHTLALLVLWISFLIPYFFRNLV